MSNLRVPGPTPCPPEVLQAMTRQMVNHRGSECEKEIRDVTAKLKVFFQTKNDVLILTGSGTGGLEAAVVNTLSPGDKALFISIGVFGDRFTNIARTFGADVIPLQFEWGKAADIDAIRKALQAEPKIKSVYITHNETSTGVTNDIEAIGKVVKEFDKLFVVDSVSGLGSINLPVDAWHCDVVICGSQKGWMVPPGLAFISVSEAGWNAHKNAKMPRFYWDFAQAKKYLENNQTPWTPAVSILFGLNVSLDMMMKEGLPNIIARHARVGKAARDGIKSLGLSLFADEAHASDTVTAIKVPPGLDSKKLLNILHDDYDVVLAGGQNKLSGKIFRIGHLGWVDVNDIKEVISALKVALPKAGFVRG